MRRISGSRPRRQGGDEYGPPNKPKPKKLKALTEAGRACDCADWMNGYVYYLYERKQFFVWNRSSRRWELDPGPIVDRLARDYIAAAVRIFGSDPEEREKVESLRARRSLARPPDARGAAGQPPTRCGSAWGRLGTVGEPVVTPSSCWQSRRRRATVPRAPGFARARPSSWLGARRRSAASGQRAPSGHWGPPPTGLLALRRQSGEGTGVPVTGAHRLHLS